MFSVGGLRVGVDLVLIQRVFDLMENERWISRVYTPHEQALLETLSKPRQAEFLAGRFAIKEAVAKAAHVGIGGTIGFQDVSTLYQPDGAPLILISDKAKNYLTNTLGLSGECEGSISHSPGENGGLGYAVAMVVLT